jgi:serine/threonine protein kinase
MLGASVAGYRIEAVAGRGGMGVVYRARQLALDRTVALKLINPELARDDTFRARFERESRIAASLDHPNVIPVYEAGSDGTGCSSRCGSWTGPTSAG